jgi:cell wall assembly regulator SMI1
MRLSELYLIDGSNNLVKLYRRPLGNKMLIELSSGPIVKIDIINRRYYYQAVKQVIGQSWVEEVMTTTELLKIARKRKRFSFHLN